MRKRRSKASEEAQLKFYLQLPSLLKYAIKWTGVVLIASFFFSMLKAFAGQKTLAVVWANLESNFISLDL